MRWLMETLLDRPLNWLHDRVCPCSTYTEMIARSVDDDNEGHRDAT